LKKFSAFLLIIASFSCATLQKTTVDKSIEKTWKQMNASKEATKTLFNNSKYGMFIHWGLYSIPGGVWEGKKMGEMGRPNVAEWVQYVAEIPRAEYAKLAPQFNPTQFDADTIAKLALK
tara:strand:- start:894 stop:1250 length:357 start_codon:yes stop_codon:yes gene_type:complete